MLDFQIAFMAPVLYAHYKYIRIMQPLIKQSKRSTIPLIVLDDLNKI